MVLLTNHIRAMIDNAVAMYCFLDDYLKLIKHREDKQCKMNDAEIMMTALIASFYFGGNHEHALTYVREQGLCKCVLSKSRFNRRLHAIEELAYSIFQCVGETVKGFNTRMEYVMDSFPVKVCHNIRINTNRLLPLNKEYSMEDMKKVGRVGVKALLYFEIVSTLALAIGLVVVSVIRPGAGMNADVSKLDTRALETFTAKAQSHGTVDFLMNIIPNTVVDAFAKGDILQVLFFSVLFGFALSMLGQRGKVAFNVIDEVAHVLFGVVGVIMKVAPIGAFGAMAFTIGKFGLGSLSKLGMLMVSFYLTCLLFIFIVLGSIARLCGFSILKFIKYIKEELLIVLGTSSSESVLPRMMAKLENLGCSKSVVGLVIPTGYSFNLDGTSIYRSEEHT